MLGGVLRIRGGGASGFGSRRRRFRFRPSLIRIVVGCWDFGVFDRGVVLL